MGTVDFKKHPPPQKVGQGPGSVNPRFPAGFSSNFPATFPRSDPGNSHSLFEFSENTPHSGWEQSSGECQPKVLGKVRLSRPAIPFFEIRKRSTKTSDRNLQFCRGMFSTGLEFSPMDFPLCPGRFSVQFSKDIAPKCGDICTGRRKIGGLRKEKCRFGLVTTGSWPGLALSVVVHLPKFGSSQCEEEGCGNYKNQKRRFRNPGHLNQGPLNGGVSDGGVSRSGLVLPFLSFFVLFGTFPIFLGFS